METWQILLLIALFLIVIFVWWTRRKAALALLAKKPSQTLGMKAIALGEQVPIYGQALKVVATVGKPVNHALDKVNAGITTGLQHIPIAGKYLAMPNQALGSGIKKLNSWLGLD
jgi:hypothetical protein